LGPLVDELTERLGELPPLSVPSTTTQVAIAPASRSPTIQARLRRWSGTWMDGRCWACWGCDMRFSLTETAIAVGKAPRICRGGVTIDGTSFMA
jgi:hypothetical protein